MRGTPLLRRSSALSTDRDEKGARSNLEEVLVALVFLLQVAVFQQGKDMLPLQHAVVSSAFKVNRLSVPSNDLVGDRGMISQKQIATLNETSGVEWISALKSGAIRMPIPPKLDSRSEATHGMDAVYALRVTSVNVGLRRHG